MNRTQLPVPFNVMLYALFAVTTFCSCGVTGTYQRSGDIAGGRLYRDRDSTDTTTIADLPWEQMFNDSLLRNLIQVGINNNLDLKIAVARIRQSRANLLQSNAVFWPAVAGHLTASEQKLSEVKGATQGYQLYGSASWEADIWGKLKSSRRAALASLLQSDAYRKAVQTQLVADIANSYYLLTAYDAQLQVTLKTVENRTLDVATMKQLKESDVVTGAAVVQSEANRYSAEVTIPDLKQNIRETENALSILLGRPPGSITRDSLANQQTQTVLQTGVPAQLLANRPDVMQSEYQLRYYYELVNVAKTYFYPSLTITAEAGLSNGSISKFFSVSSFFQNIIGGLTQPIFNQGLNRQRLGVAQGQQEEYLANFRKTVLLAGQEVSNALYNYLAATEKITIRSQQIAFLQKSVDYTKELLKYTANTNYTDVLTSEQSLLAAQLNSVSDRLQQLQATVELYRSLGGGWK